MPAKEGRSIRSAGHVSEWILTSLIVAGFINVVYRFFVDGRLPQPFIFDTNDTFMDWYNTAEFAHRFGAYEVWHSVYPPLSFVFIRIFSIHDCYTYSSLYGRDCDPIGWITLLVAFCVACLLAGRAFRFNDLSTSRLRTIAFSLSFPMLFALERGNLIIVTLIFFILAYDGVARSNWLRAVSLAMTINFKPYLIIPCLAYAIKRKWLIMELCAIGSIFIWIGAYVVMGVGTPVDVLTNMRDFIRAGQNNIWELAFYTTSLNSFLPFNTNVFPTRDYLASNIVDLFFAVNYYAVRLTMAFAVVSLAFSFLQPKVLSKSRIAAILIGAYFVWSSPGGYAETFIVFLVFLEKRSSCLIAITVFMAYLISIPYDYVFYGLFHTFDAKNWLSGRPVSTDYGLSVGIFARPALLLIMVWGLILDSLVMVARAHAQIRPTISLRRFNALAETKL